LYPLGREQLSSVIGEAVQEFRGRGLEVQPGTMSTLITGSEASVFAGLQAAFHKACGHGKVVMVVAVSNACPLPHRDSPE
jgi:uncharacterized protein YqgV (UPF0045/DUF77 family)